MNPIPPPLPVPFDWPLALLASVVVAWVAVMYGLLLWAQWRTSRRRARVRCPKLHRDADVNVRIDHRERPVYLLSCSLLPGGITCDQACLGALPR